MAAAARRSGGRGAGSTAAAMVVMAVLLLALIVAAAFPLALAAGDAGKADLSSQLPKWTIEDWCRRHRQELQEQQSQKQLQQHQQLPESSRLFLEKLNLPTLHPFCEDSEEGNESNGSNRYRPYELPGVPRQGPLLDYHVYDETLLDRLTTLSYSVFPSLLAMGELWLRLFASLAAPLGMLHLFRVAVSVNGGGGSIAANSKNPTFLSAICVLTVASSLVVATDELYLLEFGGSAASRNRSGKCWTLFAASLILSTAVAYRNNLRAAMAFKLGVVLLAAQALLDYESSGAADFTASIEEGLYYDSSNARADRLVGGYWPAEERTYGTFAGVGSATWPAPTPWMPTGDSRTGLPFLLNHVPAPEYVRVWLPVDGGEEYAALDVSFPTTTTTTTTRDSNSAGRGGHDFDSPAVYLVLHGLNGGSNEEYVKDFVRRRNSEGSTVVVFVARGLMDLPVREYNFLSLFRCVRFFFGFVVFVALSPRRGRQTHQQLNVHLFRGCFLRGSDLKQEGGTSSTGRGGRMPTRPLRPCGGLSAPNVGSYWRGLATRWGR